MLKVGDGKLKLIHNNRVQYLLSSRTYHGSVSSEQEPNNPRGNVFLEDRNQPIPTRLKRHCEYNVSTAKPGRESGEIASWPPNRLVISPRLYRDYASIDEDFLLACPDLKIVAAGVGVRFPRATRLFSPSTPLINDLNKL